MLTRALSGFRTGGDGSLYGKMQLLTVQKGFLTMQHLYLLYAFSTFSIGLISLGIISFVALKSQEKLVRYYLYFHSALTLQVLLHMFSLYMSGSDMSSSHPTLFQFFKYAHIIITQYLLMATLPIFIHHLFSVPHARLKNIAWAIIAVLTYGLDNFATFVVSDKTIQQIGDHLENGMLMTVILYSFFTGLYYFKKIEDEARKKLAAKLLIFLGLFLPSLVNEIFHFDLLKIHLYPMLYSCLSVVFSHHLIVHFLSHYHMAPSVSSFDSETGAVPEGHSESISHEEIFQQYQISPREQELVALVLEGCSNQKIAESLFISLSTVKTHLRNIYSKFGINSRYELIAFFQNPQKNNLPEEKSLQAE